MIQTPEKLSAEAKEALRRFDMLAGNTLKQESSDTDATEKNKGKGKKKFMDKIKEGLEG